MYKSMGVLALAAMLAACQDQSTAVPDPDLLYDSQAVPAVAYTIPVDFQDIDVCGVDIADATGTFHRTRRRASDPKTGLNHLVIVDHYDLMFVGRTTGWTWRWNETIVRAHQWRDTPDADGPDTWMRLNDHARVIGYGDAPSFDINIVHHLTVNANGDLVSEQLRMEPFCGN